MAHRASRSDRIGDAPSAHGARWIARSKQRMPEDASQGADPASTLLSSAYLVLRVIAAVIGVVVSLAAWGFHELVYQIQREAFHHLPSAVNKLEESGA
jgi:hypothetical protein